MLELARCLSKADPAHRPKRSIAFVGYDLEENGLWGSRYMAEHPPFPLDRLKLFITADMIGRSLGGVCDEYVFVMGTEYTPGLQPWLEAAGKDLSLRPALIGSDLLLFDRSDYGPFRKKKIPYLFFSTGESPVYHTPEDKPDTIDYPKLTEISRMIHRVASEAASSPSVPGWVTKPEHPLAEAIVVREVLMRLLEHQAELSFKPAHARWVKSQISDLDEAIRRGVLTPLERRRMVINAQLILYSVL
jgi:Zn-dependent M28 family amino/carboxypeptidase